MKSITKLPRALLNTSLGRGRNRLSRLVVLAVLVGITYAIYHQLSQQTLKKSPGDGGILKNIKERHMNEDNFGIPNSNNPADINYKDGRNSANQIIAERHQDTGESPDDDYREKANHMEQQQNADAGFDNLDGAGIENDNKNGDFGNQNYQNAYIAAREQEKQESYRDGDKDGGMEAGDAIDEAIHEEMAKLDLMELKRNHVILSEDEAAHPDNDVAGRIVKGEEVEPADGGERNEEEVAALPRKKNELAEGVEDKKEVVGADAADMKAGDSDVAVGKLKGL